MNRSLHVLLWYDLGPKLPGAAQLTRRPVTVISIYCYDAKLLAKMASLINENLL